MSLTIKNYLPGIVIFILCILLSLFTYKDFGMGWDESIQRGIGIVSYDYVANDDHTLDTYPHREYGTGFEIPLIYLEKAFELEDTRDIYRMRHLVSHLFFLLGCFCGYILCWRLFRNNVTACIGFLMLVFHPRIFAHSYFNSKDVPFLAMFLVTLLLCQVAFDKNRGYLYLLLGMACGYTTSIRIPGIILMCIITAVLLADLVRACYKRERIGHQFIYLIGFAGAACFTLYAAFPTLWTSPVKSFLEVFESNSHYRWVGSVLFQGEITPGPALPWYYLPTWFCISTPVLWLVMGGIAIILLTINLLRNPVKFLVNTRERNFLIYLGCFLLPVAVIIFLKSVVYDDWRHVYFIYPPFVLLVLYLLEKICKGKWKKAVLSVVAVQFIFIGYFMLTAHPYPQVYFNKLVCQSPEFLRKNYEMDYWGCAYKEGLEYILKHDSSEKVRVNTPVHEILIENGLAMMPVAMRGRVQQDDLDHADYMITNFRGYLGEYDYPVFYEIKVCNSTILRVYKLK